MPIQTFSRENLNPGTSEEVFLPNPEARWHVLWARSNFEQIVHDQLVEKGFQSFFPKIGHWSKRKGKRYLSHTPMFSGYLFLRHAMDKYSYIDVYKTKGLVCILGERWDRLGLVPDNETDVIRTAIAAGLPMMPHLSVFTVRYRLGTVQDPAKTTDIGD